MRNPVRLLGTTLATAALLGVSAPVALAHGQSREGRPDSGWGRHRDAQPGQAHQAHGRGHHYGWDHQRDHDRAGWRHSGWHPRGEARGWDKAAPTGPSPAPSPTPAPPATSPEPAQPAIAGRTALPRSFDRHKAMLVKVLTSASTNLANLQKQIANSDFGGNDDLRNKILDAISVRKVSVDALLRQAQDATSVDDLRAVLAGLKDLFPGYAYEGDDSAVQDAA